MDDGKNCRNCGAPLCENGDCEYCGTKKQREYISQIEISADFIRLSTMSAEAMQKAADRYKKIARYIE